MAPSTCSPRLSVPPPPASSPDRPPSARVAAFSPRRPGVASFSPPAPTRRAGVTAMAVVKKYKGARMREKWLQQMIEKKVQEAWDELEELSEAKAELRRRLAVGGPDPLESFCGENPDATEDRAAPPGIAAASTTRHP